jgi:hypothetical protein
MEHALHLAAKHFVERVAPTSASALLKKTAEEDDDDDETDFDVADTIGKALSLVTQIRKSPQARVFFKKCCAEVDLPPLELLKWVRTRWASLFKMLERVIRLRKVCFILSFMFYLIYLILRE